MKYLVKVVDYRRSELMETSFHHPRAFSEVMERLSFCMNELSIGWGYTKCLEYAEGKPMLVRKESPISNAWVESSSPARVDLAGGWSDTPPICYEYGGTVTGMAVRVDAQKPLSCRCRLVQGQKGIMLRSENRRSLDGVLVNAVEVDITDVTGLADFRDPMADCALLKAALICLCLVSEDEICSNAPLQDKVNLFCSSGDDNVRLEIISTSILPQGSGMGTSSILAATVLACISKCVGYGDLEEDHLLHAVLMLEQLLTSGGGWQDQAHGIIPGIKTVSSAPSQLPVALTVERIPLSESLKKELESRIVLVFTGMTRLARNILQDVLRRWSRRTNEVVKTVSRNVELAEHCRAAIIAGDVDRVGEILTDYSAIKVQGMAGEDSGALPESCKIFISSLLDKKMISGASLCGAGGGGFMVLILSDGQTQEKVSDFLETELVQAHPDLSGFSFHSCQICDEGLTTVVLEKGVQQHTY
jgi:fucokinase